MGTLPQTQEDPPHLRCGGYGAVVKYSSGVVVKYSTGVVVKYSTGVAVKYSTVQDAYSCRTDINVRIHNQY
jgi:hypothetical protein